MKKKGGWGLMTLSVFCNEKGKGIREKCKVGTTTKWIIFPPCGSSSYHTIFFNPRVLIWHSLGVLWIESVALCTWCVALFWHLHSETFFKIYFHFTKKVFSMENIRIAYSNGHLFEITFILERVKVFEK